MLSGTGCEIASRYSCTIRISHLLTNRVIDSLFQSLYPRGSDPFPWSCGPTDPELQTCLVGERGEQEGSWKSLTGSGCVPAERRRRAAPGGKGRSLASAAGRRKSCEGAEEG